MLTSVQYIYHIIITIYLSAKYFMNANVKFTFFSFKISSYHLALSLLLISGS
jgi:hypothetical protein